MFKSTIKHPNTYVISNDREKSLPTSIVRYAYFARFLALARNDIFVVFLIILLSACSDKKTTSTDTATTNKDAVENTSQKNILFFGDSLTAGYGLDDISESYPSVVQSKIDSAKLPYKVINAGLSGETTAGGKGRISWILKQKVDVFVLELGANDGLRGIPVKATAQNLQDIVDSVKAKYPQAKLMITGMMVPPNMGAAYANDFKGVFPAIAAKNNMTLIPFLLKDVAGNPALNQKDGIHPTAEGAKIVGNNVWAVLKNIL